MFRTTPQTAATGGPCRTGRRWLWPAAVVTVALLALALGGAHRGARAQSATTVQVSVNAALGLTILTDPNGMTLYTFSNDVQGDGTSRCNGGCASVWPAFQPPAGDLTLPDGATGALAVITRADGTMQLTYNGWPLYFYARDSNPGDANGQGVGSVWYAAQP